MASDVSRRTPLPICTLSLLALAVLIDASTPLAASLSLERDLVYRGQVWRLLTGHLVHEVPGVALVDLTLFAGLGAWIEGRSRRLLVAVLLASALLSSLALLFLTDHQRSVGSSGVGSGLFLAATVIASRGRRRGLALALLAVFAIKLLLEISGLWRSAAGVLPDGYETSAALHLGGAAGGLVAALPRGVLRPRGSLRLPAQPSRHEIYERR